MPLSIHSELAILKDTPCGIFFTLAIYLIYKTITTNNIKNYLPYDIAISISLLLTTLMRPNSLLLSFPLIIILFIIYKNHIKSTINIAAIFIISFFIITFPVYNLLNIERYNDTNKYIETMSLPIECIANVVKNRGENFNYSPSLKSFVDKMCDGNLSNIDRFDERECYESIKWDPTNEIEDVVDENLKNAVKGTNYGDYINWSFEVLTKEPILTITQFCHHIKGLIAKRFIKERLVKKWYANIYYIVADFEIPILLLLFIIILLAKNPIYKKSDTTNYLLSIPIFLYLIGTTIAMSMSSIYRYFMPFHIAFPIYVLYNLYKTKPKP